MSAPVKLSGKGGKGKASAASFDDAGGDDEEDQELLEQVIDIIRQTQRASTSSIQRRLRIGYNRASRLMDILEEKGLVGPARGAEPREILFDVGLGDGGGNDDAGTDGSGGN